MKKQKLKHACVNHPDRSAVVERSGRELCWQCYLGDEIFIKRFGPDFYIKEKKL